MRVAALILLLCNSYLIAISGDDPCGATILDPGSTDVQYFDNTGFTDSGVPSPPYGAYAGSDFWFSFTMPSIGYVNLILSEVTLSNPAIAIYSGPCDDPKLLYNIPDNNCGNGNSPAAVLDELTPGEEYFIRVWSENNSSNGLFGIFLSETSEFMPEFILHSDATEDDDCIMLTNESNTQHGCAWFEIPIDFTQAFTHEMTANFGDKDANGADGICLIYQSNGPDYCGGTGQGIGAGGMPNSAIFEFDTYQNGSNNDPANDHAAFNINGDMNHLNSINGPIDLGNIEDGNDHTILFNYDGSGGYELYFDGTLLLSGNYDFIGNIFSGGTTAWWGYTAATGALNNEQIICPDTEEIELGTQSYEEITICEGENYNGYYESGFYVSYVDGGGNCLHQINTLLTVIPDSEPTYLYEYICEGEVFEIEQTIYDQAGYYEILTTSALGCDSLIYLDLTIPELEVEITVPEELNCDNQELELTVNINSYPLYDDVYFNWQSPTGTGSTGWSYFATEPGIYIVEVLFYFNDKYCEKSYSINVFQDTLSPVITPLEDLQIDCNNKDSISMLYADVSGLNILYEWYLNEELIGQDQNIELQGEGFYVLSVINENNGCESKDSAYVEYSIDIPDISIIPDTLDCQNLSFTLKTGVTGITDSLRWDHNGSEFSNDLEPFIELPGKYLLTIISDDGCISKDSVFILQDTIKPIAFSNDYIIACDEEEIKISVLTDSMNLINWNGPQAINKDNFNPLVSEGGWYNFIVKNPKNHCIMKDSIFVDKLGPSPQLQIIGDTITCINPNASVLVNSDLQNLKYYWYNKDTLYDTSQNISVSSGGMYFVTASTSSGCSSGDSIFVLEDKVSPLLELIGDSLDCGKTTATIKALFDEGMDIIWADPSGGYSNKTDLTTEVEGLYTARLTNPENGCFSIDSVLVIDHGFDIDITFVTDTISCSTPEVNLNLEIDSDFESLIWKFPDGKFIFDQNPATSLAGSYELHIEVEGPCDIDTILNIEIDIASPEIKIVADTIECNNLTADINIESTSELSSILIISPSGIHFLENYISTNEPGIYFVEAKGENGCIALDSIEVLAFLDKPEIQLNSSGVITCDQPSVTLTFNSPDSDLVDVKWMGPDNYSSTNSIVSIENGGLYYLECTNSHGCMSLDSLLIESFNEIPTLFISGNDIDCYSPASVISFTSPDNIAQIDWYNEKGTRISGENSLSIHQGGLYFLQIKNLYGCISHDSIFIEENTDPPEISILSINPLIVLTYTPDREHIEIEVISSVSFDIEWEPKEGLSCYDCLSPIVLGDEIEFYTVQVQNLFGCLAEESIQVRYKNRSIVTIPNVFSPSNNDKINDHFSLFSNENIEIINELYIYDRWGNLIIHKRNFPPNKPEEGWDGKFRGEKVVKGVYLYYFRVSTIDGEEEVYAGDVTVI